MDKQLHAKALNLNAAASNPAAVLPFLARRELEFRGADQGGGLAAPPAMCTSIGTLYPIALWGLTSL